MYPEYEHRSRPLIIHSNTSATAYPLRLHKHIELMRVCTGTAEVTIGTASYTLGEGDMYIVFPDILHSATIPKGSSRLLFLFSPDMVPDFADTFCRSCPETPVLRRGEYPELLLLLQERIHQLYRHDLAAGSTISCHLNSMVSELLPLLTLTDRSSDSDLIHKMVLYLLEHYTEEISLEDMARHLGYSKYHISHVVSGTFRCNFRTLLNSYRIGMAQNLMLSTGKTISQIAFSCGFRNQSSFNRIFLKHCGMTPSSFREQAAAETVEAPHLIIK